MRYALMVAETGSVNGAAQRYFLDAPSISRAVKALERDLGTQIFARSPKGMVLTPDGELFVQNARGVLRQVDALEGLFAERAEHRVRKQRFSVSVPRASYIADAFVRFVRQLPQDGGLELYYKETNARRTIRNLLEEDYTLGILRFAKGYEKYFRLMLEEKQLIGEPVGEFSYVLLVGKDSDLANGAPVTSERLSRHTEIAHADPFVPTLPMATVQKEELPADTDRRIYVFERASQLELLSRDPGTYMWVSPVPQPLLDRYGLVQFPCAVNDRVYQDMLVRRSDRALTPLDEAFLAELYAARDRAIGEKGGTGA